MKQDIIDQLSEQSDYKTELPINTEDLTLPRNTLKINLQETEEREVALTFQRRPQYRINENNRRRFD
ncbi:MAG: hypothetical protein M3Z92_05560 [Bacteroidota bacterium]|nr:hypothetical protein [Bacteroidota bacterium]